MQKKSKYLVRNFEDLERLMKEGKTRKKSFLEEHGDTIHETLVKLCELLGLPLYCLKNHGNGHWTLYLHEEIDLPNRPFLRVEYVDIITGGKVEDAGLRIRLFSEGPDVITDSDDTLPEDLEYTLSRVLADWVIKQL